MGRMIKKAEVGTNETDSTEPSQEQRSHDDEHEQEEEIVAEDDEDAQLILEGEETIEPLRSSEQQMQLQNQLRNNATVILPRQRSTTAIAATRPQQQQQQHQRCSSWWPLVGTRVPPTKKLAEHLARRLYDASDVLLARLFAYLSNLPEPPPIANDRLLSVRNSESAWNSGEHNSAIVSPSGVTLPVSALAWLSSQIIYLRRSRQHQRQQQQQQQQQLNDSLLEDNENDDDDDDDLFDAGACSLDWDQLEQHQQQYRHMENALWMGSSMRDRLLLIHFLLPRATHLRLVPEAWPPPKTNRQMQRTRRLQAQQENRAGNSNNRHNRSSSSLEAEQDLAFSTMSVQSALTEEDPGPPEPNATSFLQNFYHLEQRPRIDVTIFSNLQVLLLDQVPPDCVLNLHHACHTLRVLRVERACVYNLHDFLFGKQKQQHPVRPREIPNNVDPLAAPPSSQEEEDDDSSSILYSQLTHIKLSHCCIGEMSGMRATRKIPSPPLSRCPRLVSLCLSHNQLFRSSTALAGLSALPWLHKLDLSHNQIVSMKNAHLRLGNLKILVLTGNKIRSASGLDRLYALEQLWLDDNDIRDVASLNGLSRLPELSVLYLFGNPVELLQPIRYRIDILSLFMCRLTSSLGPNGTYRQLQHVLPLLDGKLASLREMVALRNRTFQSIVSPPINPRAGHESTSSILQHEAENSTLEVDGVEDIPNTEASMSLESTTVTPKKSTRTSTSSKGRSGRVRRSARRRNAVIENDDDAYVLVSWPPEESSRNVTEQRVAPVTHADESSATEAIPPFSERSMHVAFSIHDVISAISGDYGVTLETKVIISNVAPTDDNTAPLLHEQLVFPDEVSLKSAPELHNEQRGDEVVTLTFEPNVQLSAPRDEDPNITQLSISSVKHDGDDHEFSESNTGLKGQNDEPDNAGSKVSEVKSNVDAHDHSENMQLWTDPIQINSKSSDVFNLQEMPTNPFGNDSAPTNPFESEEKLTNPFENESSTINPFDDEATKPSVFDTQQVLSKPPAVDKQFVSSNANESQAMSTDTRKDASSIESLSENIDRNSMPFADDVWQDDQSVPSSIGAGGGGVQREELSTDLKFQLAEENSIYDGPPGYQSLPVLEHLELYFRCFVFPTTIPPALQAALNDTMVDSWEMSLILYPRLQLQPIDRQMMVSTNATPGVAHLSQLLTHREQLVRVWREDVVACGKPAARRLFPNRHTRLGFHGEILWTNAKIDVVTECRKAILCLSNAALYVIIEHDAVTDKLKEHTKKFPLPMSNEAKFNDAPWPHAVARHSLLTLEQITIGFGFQRLILRFSNATYPSNDHFTYVLLVSNKVEAISLLQDLQRSAKEANLGIASSASLDDETIETKLEIDNDDKHFLEALASAVAPAVIGAVIHYQVLRQRWQHGERGNVRRSCVVTDSKLFLLDEDYAGDGSLSFEVGDESKRLGDVNFRLVDSADLDQITQVKAADADPKAITIVIRPPSRLQRIHRWRLVCRDGDGAERLVEDVRKAMSLL